MMMNIFKWPYVKRTNASRCNIDYEKFRIPELRQQYQNEVSSLFKPSEAGSTNQQRWNNIAKTTITAAENTVGLKSVSKKCTIPEVVKLSEEQKHIKTLIDSSKNSENRAVLRRSWNNKLRQIHNLLQEEERVRIERKIESIESQKNDSTRMFAVIKEINRDKPKVPLLIKGMYSYCKSS